MLFGWSASQRPYLPSTGIKPLNYEGKTGEKGKVIELDDVVAKKLIEKKAVEEVKEQKIETKSGEQKWEL